MMPFGLLVYYNRGDFCRTRRFIREWAFIRSFMLSFRGTKFLDIDEQYRRLYSEAVSNSISFKVMRDNNRLSSDRFLGKLQ